MKRRLSVLAFAAAVVCVFGMTARASDSNIGTWKLNVAQSRFNPGPDPKNQVMQIEAWGTDGVKYVANGVDGNGATTHSEFRVKYDGKFVSIVGDPDADTIAYTRVNANTVEATTRLRGQQTAIIRDVISVDGKTRTLTQTGKNAAGQVVHHTIVYDRQ